MSIRDATQVVRAQGRGRDSELMHVTPGEVQALQGIAQLHGGSLTRNPQTGLAEAGFLESILPTVLGVGIGVATGNPFLGAAVAGGVGYGVSGSLEKGLMSGLGAFGGASALAGLGAAGATGGAAAAGGASGGVGAAGVNTSIGAGSSIMAPTSTALFPNLAAGSTGTMGTAGGVLNATAPGASILAPTTTGSTAGILSGTQAAALTPAQQFGAMSIGDKFGAIGTGFSDLGFKGSIGAMGKGNLLMAGAPLLGALSPEQQEFDIPEQESYYRPQSYDQATQTYTALEPIKSSDLGAMSITDYKRSQGYQEGGEVQQRYTQPVRTVDPTVTEYNQMLMDQARQEYVQQQPMTNVPQLTPSLMAPPAPTPATATATEPDMSGIAASRKYVFDRGTQTYLDNPNYVDPVEQARLDKLAQRESSRSRSYNYDSDGGYDSGGINYGYEMGYDYSDDDIGGGTGPSNASAADMGGEDVAQGGRIRRKFAQGGIASLKNNVPSFQAGGEMESDSFIVPADVVSALGNGSTDAGVDLLNQYIGMAMPIEGEGDGLSDDVPTSIEGDQPARVADGEVYIPAEVVAMLGQGDPELGSSKLYTMMDKIREAAHGKKDQQREVKPESVMPA